MPRKRSHSLGARADQAGLLFAAANAPLTFQRTLMPRATMDQALVTGLSASSNHALVALLQESIQAAVLALTGQAHAGAVDEARWGRTVLGADLAAIGAGIVVQRAFARREREPLTRAGIRTGGFWLSTTGTAAAVVGALQEGFAAGGERRGRTLAYIAPAAGALMGANTWLVRRRERADADLPPEDVQASLAKSLAYGVAVAGGLTAFGTVERRFADVLSRGVSRVLPGNAEVWRPLAHAASLAAFGAAARYAAEAMFHRIENVQESVEAAFDIAPPNELVSGSYESLVPFATLSPRGAGSCGWSHRRASSRT